MVVVSGTQQIISIHRRRVNWLLFSVGERMAVNGSGRYYLLNHNLWSFSNPGGISECKLQLLPLGRGGCLLFVCLFISPTHCISGGRCGGLLGLASLEQQQQQSVPDQLSLAHLLSWPAAVAFN